MPQKSSKLDLESRFWRLFGNFGAPVARTLYCKWQHAEKYSVCNTHAKRCALQCAENSVNTGVFSSIQKNTINTVFFAKVGKNQSYLPRRCKQHRKYPRFRHLASQSWCPTLIYSIAGLRSATMYTHYVDRSIGRDRYYRDIIEIW